MTGSATTKNETRALRLAGAAMGADVTRKIYGDVEADFDAANGNLIAYAINSGQTLAQAARAATAAKMIDPDDPFAIAAQDIDPETVAAVGEPKGMHDFVARQVKAIKGSVEEEQRSPLIRVAALKRMMRAGSMSPPNVASAFRSIGEATQEVGATEATRHAAVGFAIAGQATIDRERESTRTQGRTSKER